MITKDRKTIAGMAVSASVIGLLAWAVISSLGLLGCGCAAPASTSQDTSPIAHFRWLDKDWGICASAQPMTAQEWLWLASQAAGQSGQGMGRMNSILKLNTDSEGSDNMAVISYGFSLEYDPISVAWQTNPVYHSELDKYIREVCHLIRPGTLIHCLHGDDRTGAVVYAYRRNCGWTDAQARLEMMTNGFHTELLGLAYFVDHYQPELSSPGTPKAWKAQLRSQRP